MIATLGNTTRKYTVTPLGISGNIHSHSWYRRDTWSPKFELGTHFLEAIVYIVYNFYTRVSTTNLILKELVSFLKGKMWFVNELKSKLYMMIWGAL